MIPCIENSNMNIWSKYLMYQLLFIFKLHQNKTIIILRVDTQFRQTSDGHKNIRKIVLNFFISSNKILEGTFYLKVI